MKLHIKICALMSVTLLCACGKVGQLEPRIGAKPIPVAYGNEKPANSDELNTASAQQRPGRSVELLRRSVRRADDPFDLPPGSQPETANADAARGAAETATTPPPKAD
jgi:hypothetical protein